MDRKQLKELLQPFSNQCAEKGKPLTDMCIEEAFPGDSSTSYIVQVKADWVDSTSCSDAIDFLFEILWETTDEETRKRIFSIQVLDTTDTLQCWSDSPITQF
jgi:hypothetical protein